MMNRIHRLSRVDADTGAGTVLMLGIVLGAISLTVAAVLLSSAAVSGARAGTAANLAALAGADALRGLRSGDPCVLAAAVAERNKARVGQCAPDSQARTVTGTVETAAVLLPWPAKAQARAGPPPDGSPGPG